MLQTINNVQNPTFCNIFKQFITLVSSQVFNIFKQKYFR